jgi:hypothetical protein
MDVPAGRSLVPEIAGSNPASATLPWRARSAGERRGYEGSSPSPAGHLTEYPGGATLEE